MNTKLLGTREWDPTAESFWGIANKLCAYNHMHWSEARNILSPDKKATVSSMESRNPDNISNISINKICRYTGWTPKQLESSFSKFYLPCWLQQTPVDEDTFSSSLRLCPVCAAEGIHLTIHQFTDWHRCPIHEKKLTQNCIKCGGELGRMLLMDDFPNRPACMNCSWTLWASNTSNTTDVDLKGYFTKDYQQWLRSINDTVNANNSVYIWLNEPKYYSDIALVDYFNKRSVFREKYFNNVEIDVREHYRSDIDLVRSKNKLIFRQRSTDVEAEKAIVCSENDIHVTMENMLQVSIQSKFNYIEKKYSVAGYRAGIYEYSNKHCVVQHGFGINCWSTALWMLRRCLDAAWPVHERWSRSTPVEQLSESTIVRDWINSFRLIKNLSEPYNSFNEEEKAFYSLSCFWIEEWVRAVFYGFVALACHANDRQAFKTEELAEHVRELGLIPLFVFVRKPEGLQLNLLTTMANPSVFKALFDNGFKGNDEYFFSDAKNIFQIYNAAGLNPIRKHRWETDYRRARNSVAAKLRKKDG